MPGPLVIQKPELNASINPQGASVFDAPGQGMLRKIVGWLGLDDPQQIMNVGIAMDVGPMGGGLLEKIAERYPRFANAIKAYHGSPHDFEAFDTSKIGTGEGAQAYGHGLYFAENPAVAQEYKKALTDFEVHEPSGRIIGSGGPKQTYKGTIEDRALAWVQDAASRNDIADPFKFAMGNARRGLSDDANGQAIVDQIRKWQDAGAVIKPGGRMYEVGINAHPDQFLDWDKPLSQQHPDVQAALRKIDPARMDIIRNKSFDISASKFYDDLATKLHQTGQGHLDNAAATNALKEAGIPGIKYLDQGSRVQVPLLDNQPLNRFAPSNPVETRAIDALRRNTSAAEAIDYLKQDSGTEAAQQWLQANAHRIQQPQGTRNFVVFDAKTVDILKKYGLLLPAAGAGLAASQPPPTPIPGDQ
jgi:hypothetical protein